MSSRGALLSFLAELSESAGAAHSEPGVVRAVEDVLRRYVSCRSVTLTTRGDRPPSSRRSVVIPLTGDDLADRELLLVLGDPAPGELMKLDEGLVSALSRLLSVAFQNAHLVQRVAALSLRAHTETQRLRGELERAAPTLPFVASSAVMRHLCGEIVDVVARQETTVLLVGESGTGKEVLAKRIHALSPRSARPLLKVNCGALPEMLVESTLFGHERGAFTGATQRHLGLFERAHGGTLFLDEVAELPLHAQVKLLRVLQDGELERVGGDATVRVSVRIIAATHRPVEQMVERGTFRSDLYYRLSVFPIRIPPLRERVEDIAALATTTLARLSARMKRDPPRLTAAALRRLETHPWPGNVRELENVLERALVLSPGDVLHLPGELPHAQTPVQSRSTAPISFDDAERRTLEEALAATQGRIYGNGGAADRLGLKPTTLQSKLRKLGIRREAFAAMPAGATPERSLPRRR